MHKEEHPFEKIKKVDNKIDSIEYASKTLIPQFNAMHNKLREKYNWYNRWHMNRYCRLVHLAVLFLYIVGIAGGIFLFQGYVPKQAQAALSDNIVSFWKLDEADGLTRNDSVDTNNLTNTNGVTQITGKIGNASHFTAASSQTLSHVANASLNTGDIDYSVSAWIYLDSTVGNHVIINKDDVSTNREYALYYNGSTVRFIAFNGTSTIIGSVISTFGTLNTGTWYFVAAYHSATNNQVGISVNGGAFDTANTTGAAGAGSIRVTIGGNSAAGFWNGRIDAVGFWKKALTLEDVVSLYNSGSGYEYSLADVTPPTITSVSSTKTNGSYSTGDVVPINVTFSELVTSTGNVTVTLETGAIDRTCTFTVTSSTTGSCNYTVQSGDSSSDLDVLSISGTINDLANNPMVNFVPATNLATSKDLSINIIAPITQSLQAFWKLDEASGTRVDSYDSNNLTSNNSVGQATGKIGNAASFTSTSSQYLSISDNDSLSTGGGTDFTISGWVYLSTKTAAQVFISKYTSTAVGEYAVYYQSSTDRFVFATYGNNTTYSALANYFGSPSTDTWYFIVATHNSSTNTNTIRINDTYQDTGVSVEHLNSISDFNIGRFATGSLYTNGRIDAVGFWKRVLTSSEVTTLYSSGSGLEYPFTPPANSITITSPTDYRTYQRNSGNQANIPITGTYNGSPTVIEASWNGGTYTTIVASPSGGSFSGTLSNQLAGQGTLTVRFTNDTSISNSKSYIGIGDIFVIAGQSNADGYGQNNHSYTSPGSNPNLKASLFGNDDNWKNLSDPVDSNTNQVDAISSNDGTRGSVWPLIATLYLADRNIPVAFIPTSSSGTTITQWQRNDSNHGDTSTLYGSMYRRINAVGGVKAVLFWQGESDVPVTSQASYTSLLNTFTNDVTSDFDIKTVVAQIGDWSSEPGDQLDNIRLAQKAVWDSNVNVIAGPSLYDVVLTVDGLHFKTDSEQQTAANRWWATIQKGLYATGDGRGPQISAAEYNSAKTQITLTFTDDTLPLLPASGFGGIIVKDNGVVATISTITKTATNKLLATLSSAASGTITVSLGAGRTGTGATVPTDSSTYNLPAEVFVDYVATAIPLANIPSAPTIITTSTTSLTVIVNINGNPDTTEYAISCDGDSTFLNYSTNACGAITDDANHWRTYANWGGASGFIDTGLSVNTNHTYKVIARNSENTETALSSGASKYTLANPPTSATIDSFTATGIDWSWNANSNPGTTNFYASDSAGNSGWTTATTWNQSGLGINTSYTLIVKAKNGDGTETTTTSTSGYTLANQPSAPTVAGNYSVGDGYYEDVTININNNPADTNYWIQVSTDNVTYSDPVGMAWQTGTTYTLSSLSANTQYWFKAKAKNGDAVDTAYSSSGADVTPPAAPTSLNASNICSTTVSTSWVASTGADKYTLSYGTDTNATNIGTITNIASTNQNLSSLTDGNTYYWKVSAISNANGTGAYSSIPNFTTGTCLGPIAPIDFNGSAASTTQVNWTWTDTASDETGWKVEDVAHTNLSGNLAIGSTGWSETPLSINTAYTRHTNVYNANGSNDSNQATIYTLANVPDAPAVSAVPTGINIVVNKNSNPDANTRYAIFNQTAGKYVKHADGSLQDTADWQLYADWGGTGGFTNTGLSPNISYTYQVKAENGDSIATAFSGTSSVYSPANVPGTPTVNATSSTSLTTIINQNSNPAGTQFAIYNQTASQYVQADGTLGASAVWQNRVAWGGDSGIDNTGLSVNVNYNYQVKARNGNTTETALSTGAAKYTLSNPPSLASVSSRTTTGITWAWNVNSNPAGTNFYASDATGNSGWVADAISWTSTLASPNTQYLVTIKSRNGDNVENSSPISLSAYTSIETPASLATSAIATDSITTTVGGSFTNLAQGTSGIRYCNTTTSTCSPWQQTTVAYTFSGLTANTLYNFTVESRNGDSISAGIATASATTSTTLIPTPTSTPAPTSTPTPEAIASGEIKVTPIVPTETAPSTGEKKEDITLTDFQFYVVLESGNIPLTVNNENNLETVINSNVLVEVSSDIFAKKVNVITISTSGSTYLMNLLSDKNKYQAVIPMPAVKGDFEIRILIVYEDGSLKEIKNVVSVDPQGYIYTLSSSYFGLGKKQEVRISDAKVTLYSLDGGEYKLWDSAGKQPNPTLSNKSGEYAFWVPNGDYYLTIEKAGYKTVKTDNFKVENSLVTKNIEIEPTIKPLVWLVVILFALAIIIYSIVRGRKRSKLANEVD